LEKFKYLYFKLIREEKSMLNDYSANTLSLLYDLKYCPKKERNSIKTKIYDTEIERIQQRILKSNNIKFKCINKGLYRAEHNLKPYTEKEYDDFLYKLDKLPSLINMYNLTNEDLLAYYNEVLIPMKYNEEVMAILDNYFSKYIDTKKRTI
jgi:hypothetical protein